jgi:hypothetical protein
MFPPITAYQVEPLIFSPRKVDIPRRLLQPIIDTSTVGSKGSHPCAAGTPAPLGWYYNHRPPVSGIMTYVHHQLELRRPYATGYPLTYDFHIPFHASWYRVVYGARTLTEFVIKSRVILSLTDGTPPMTNSSYHGPIYQP